MNDFWYYEYIVKAWDGDNKIFETCSGVVLGKSFTNAVEELENYFGGELAEIVKLKELIEGPVLDFQIINEGSNAGFYISPKRKENDK